MSLTLDPASPLRPCAAAELFSNGRATSRQMSTENHPHTANRYLVPWASSNVSRLIKLVEYRLGVVNRQQKKPIQMCIVCTKAYAKITHSLSTEVK